MSLMPTWLIGIWRVSARLWTSSTDTTWAFGATAGFIGRTVCGLSRFDQPLGWGRSGFLRPSAARIGVLCSRARLIAGERRPPALDRGTQARRIELGLHEAILAGAVFDEAVRDAEREGRQRVRAVRKQFDHRGPGATRNGVFLDGDQRLVSRREAQH